MSAKFPNATPLTRTDASVRATMSSMQSRLGLFDLYKTAVVVIFLCAGYLEIPFYLSLEHGLPAAYFLYVIFIAAAPLLALQFGSLMSYLMSPFALWAFGLILLNLAHFMWADGERAHVIARLAQFGILAIVIGFACSVTRRTSYELVFPFLAVLIPATVILDFLSPGMFYSPDTQGVQVGRAAGLLLNPNIAGETILLTFLLAIPMLRPRYRALLLLLTGAGVILTFSRSAILAWMLLWIFLLLRNAVPRYTLAVPLGIVVALPVLLGLFEAYLSGRQDLATGLGDVVSRLQFFSDRVADDDSALDRKQVVELGLALFRENPIFGAGAAKTDFWTHYASTHNVVVRFGAEYGIFGLALWVSLAVILWKGEYFEDKALQLAAVAAFVYFSMFTNDLTHSLHWLLTLALVSGRRT